MHFSRFYQLKLAFGLNEDFWWFLELWAQEWLYYDLIMSSAMILYYDSDLVSLRDLLWFWPNIWPERLNCLIVVSRWILVFWASD